MANKRRAPVEYRPFRADPLLAEGLLGVERGGGDLERKVAAAFFRVASELGDRNDRRAAREGEIAGATNALAGRPASLTIAGGEPIGPGTPFKTNDPVATDLPAEARALLNAIAGGESAGAYNVRYTPNGGAFFSDLSSHPNIKEAGPDGPSTAAGRYQFVKPTWDRLGGGPMTPERQDHAAWRLAQDDYQARTGRPLLADLQAGGLTENVMRALAPTWAAFNGRRGSHAATYRDSLLRFAGQGTAAPDAGPAPGQAAALPVQAPKVVERSGGASFRPSGRDTVYGRAYDAAGTKTYLQALSTEMEQTTFQLFQKYGRDPQQLAEAFQVLKAEQLKDDVFPEIAAEYELAFDRRAGSFVMQAQRDLETRREQENRAAFLTRTEEMETAQQRALAVLDPENPAAADELWRGQAAIDDHYDAAVAHGLLDPDDAVVAKARSRRATAVAYYTKQAEKLDREGVAELRERMQKDFGAGKLDGIDGDSWDLLQRNLAALEREKETSDRVAQKALEDRGEAFLSRAAAGVPIDQGELGRFILDAKTAPEGSAIVRQTLSLINVAERLRSMPIAEGEKLVRSMRAGLTEKSSDRDIAAVATAEKLLAATREQLSKDLLSHAEQAGVIAPTGSVADAQSPEELKAVLTGRIDEAEAAARHFGVAPRYFKAGETAAIEAMVKADPAAGASIAAAIVSGAGSRAGAVLSEFGKSAPVIAGAGAILAGGGSALAAEDAIAGAGKAPDDREFPAIGSDIRSAAPAERIGSALMLQPADEARIRQTAGWIARKRIYDTGTDPKSEDARAIYDQAIDEAAGAIFDRGVQYGGFVAQDAPGLFTGSYRVLVPNSVRADLFGDVIAAIRPADIESMRILPVRADGQRFDVRQLSQYRAVAVNGGYAFARKDPASDDPQFVRGSDGDIWVLDIEALRPRLAPRVPGGFH